MKISLVEAGLPSESPAWTAWTAGDERFAAPGVGLVSLASLVRDGDDVEIIDEKVSGPADKVEADVVGISFKTMNAFRAYQLADKYRKNGSRVVLGGLHSSLCPQEAAQHADVVAVGEGEGIWPQILNDLEAGTHRPVYVQPRPPAPIDDLPRQRFELLEHNGYLSHAVQTARGCSLTG